MSARDLRKDITAPGKRVLKKYRFRIALIASLLIHSFFFLRFNHYKLFTSVTPPKKIEVMYQIVENPHLKETVLKQEKVNRPSQDQKLVEEGLEKLQNVGLPSFAEKPLLKNELDKEVTKPTFHRESRLVKKVTLPPVTKEKFQNPVYNNYYAIIREKIREHAYRRYARNEEGEVYASFVVSSRGQIMDLKISDEMSQASAYLKNIALASIQDAAPFPAFPEQLKHPQLTFNVIISFELDN